MNRAAANGWLKVIKSLIPLMKKPNAPHPFRTFDTEEEKWRSTPIHIATIYPNHHEMANLEIIKCLIPFEDNVTVLQVSVANATLFDCHRIKNYLTSIINPQ